VRRKMGWSWWHGGSWGPRTGRRLRKWTATAATAARCLTRRLTFVSPPAGCAPPTHPPTRTTKPHPNLKSPAHPPTTRPSLAHSTRYDGKDLILGNLLRDQQRELDKWLSPLDSVRKRIKAIQDLYSKEGSDIFTISRRIDALKRQLLFEEQQIERSQRRDAGDGENNNNSLLQGQATLLLTNGDKGVASHVSTALEVMKGQPKNNNYYGNNTSNHNNASGGVGGPLGNNGPASGSANAKAAEEAAAEEDREEDAVRERLWMGVETGRTQRCLGWLAVLLVYVCHAVSSDRGVVHTF
jgi:hypothetical protein